MEQIIEWFVDNWSPLLASFSVILTVVPKLGPFNLTPYYTLYFKLKLRKSTYWRIKGREEYVIRVEKVKKGRLYFYHLAYKENGSIDLVDLPSLPLVRIPKKDEALVELAHV